MQRKIKLLIADEGVFSSTGYAEISRQLLPRLHQQPDIELVELASFTDPRDPRLAQLPWQCIGTLPTNPQEQQAFQSNHLNNFGAWKFDQIVCQYRPDCVASWRDPFMDVFIVQSPLKPYFSHIWMVTADGAPMDEKWISDISLADYVTGYTQWGLDQMRQQGGKQINAVDVTAPGADLQNFSIVPNKRLHKQQYGLPPDAFVVGFVARNQLRKAFPNLARAFAHFLKIAPPELAARSYMVWHTNPAEGWNVPLLLQESDISNRVLFTYLCYKCQHIDLSLYQEVRRVCPKCGAAELRSVSSQVGIQPAELSKIYNVMDCYVQYAFLEGIGVPQLEAAACGLPLFAVPYSGMQDIVDKLGATPITIKTYYRELNTHRFFAVPDDEGFARQLLEFAQLPEKDRKIRGFKTRMALEKHFTWDECAARWLKLIRGCKLRDADWAKPPRLHQPAASAPEGLSDSDFVDWCLIHIVGRPELCDSYTSLKLAKDLQNGFTVGLLPQGYYADLSAFGQAHPAPFTRQNCLDLFRQMNYNYNQFESRRWQLVSQGSQ